MAEMKKHTFPKISDVPRTAGSLNSLNFYGRKSDEMKISERETAYMET